MVVYDLEGDLVMVYLARNFTAADKRYFYIVTPALMPDPRYRCAPHPTARCPCRCWA